LRLPHNRTAQALTVAGKSRYAQIAKRTDSAIDFYRRAYFAFSIKPGAIID
jgi:hypothetical protein